jgi:hypothetical protein
MGRDERRNKRNVREDLWVAAPSPDGVSRRVMLRCGGWWLVIIIAFIRTKTANKGVLTEESLVVIEWVSIACIDGEDQVEFFLISHTRLRTHIVIDRNPF